MWWCTCNSDGLNCMISLNSLLLSSGAMPAPASMTSITSMPCTYGSSPLQFSNSSTWWIDVLFKLEKTFKQLKNEKNAEKEEEFEFEEGERENIEKKLFFFSLSQSSSSKLFLRWEPEVGRSLRLILSLFASWDGVRLIRRLGLSAGTLRSFMVTDWPSGVNWKVKKWKKIKGKRDRGER